MKHPRDKFLTVYGRKPVLEALQDNSLQIDKLFIAQNSKGEIIEKILFLCKKRNINIIETNRNEVSRMSKHPKQDQGIALDVNTPLANDALDYLSGFSDKQSSLFALDGVTTPSNLGLIIRTATSLGIDGVIIPRKGTSKINSFVIKSSAGTIFKSSLLKCEKLITALIIAKENGFVIYALSGEQGKDIYHTDFNEKSIFVFGNESEGVSEAIEKIVDFHITIPMSNNVESMNVACASAVVASEITRRKLI